MENLIRELEEINKGLSRMAKSLQALEYVVTDMVATLQSTHLGDDSIKRESYKEFRGILDYDVWSLVYKSKG